MSKKYCILFLILALAAGSGLPQGIEIEERQLVTALSVDRIEGEILLTAVTGVRASEDEEPEILAGQGIDMSEACQAIQGSRASQAYLGQAGKLLLGEALAQTDLMKTLEFVMDHRELRLDTLLYIVKGNAGEGLTATAPTVAGETPGRDKRGVSVGQVLSRLCEGERIRVPALAPGEDGQLEPAGWAVLEASGLAGYDAGEALTAGVDREGNKHV